MRFYENLEFFFLAVAVISTCSCLEISFEDSADFVLSSNITLYAENCPIAIEHPKYGRYSGVNATYHLSEKTACNSRYQEAFSRFDVDQVMIHATNRTFGRCKDMVRMIENKSLQILLSNMFTERELLDFETASFDCLGWYGLGTEIRDLRKTIDFLKVRKQFALEQKKLIDSYQELDPCDKDQETQLVNGAVAGFFSAVALLTSVTFPVFSLCAGLISLIISWSNPFDRKCEMDLTKFNEFTIALGNSRRIVEDQILFDTYLDSIVFERTSRNYTLSSDYNSLYLATENFMRTSSPFVPSFYLPGFSQQIAKSNKWICKATSIKYWIWGNDTYSATCAVSEWK